MCYELPITLEDSIARLRENEAALRARRVMSARP
jgi:hypothetical protein